MEASLEVGCARTELMDPHKYPQEYNYMDSKRLVAFLCWQPDKSTETQEEKSTLPLGKNLDQEMTHSKERVVCLPLTKRMSFQYPAGKTLGPLHSCMHFSLPFLWLITLDISFWRTLTKHNYCKFYLIMIPQYL